MVPNISLSCKKADFKYKLKSAMRKTVPQKAVSYR